MTSKEIWLAIDLSMLFPGIGQIYAGERLRGLILISIEAVLIAIAAWSFFSPAGNTVVGGVCLLPILFVYLANLFDARDCVNKHQVQRQSENNGRSNKDPWYAVFLSFILPGLGQLYAEKVIYGGIFLCLTVVFSSFAIFFPHLHIFTAIISAVACYHACVTCQRRKQSSKQAIATIAVFILVFRLIVSYLPVWIAQQIDIFRIPSNSMQPTLMVGDKIFVKKSSHYLPKRGDIIVFKEPEAIKIKFEADDRKEHFFIKRVIGEPGQVVRVTNGVVYVNDQPLQEAYVAAPPNYELEPQTVPAESYFVLGDDRNNSFDSHVWGFLLKRHIVGNAYKVFWPPERIKPL